LFEYVVGWLVFFGPAALAVAQLAIVPFVANWKERRGCVWFYGTFMWLLVTGGFGFLWPLRLLTDYDALDNPVARVEVVTTLFAALFMLVPLVAVLVVPSKRRRS